VQSAVHGSLGQFQHSSGRYCELANEGDGDLMKILRRKDEVQHLCFDSPPTESRVAAARF